MDAMIDFENNKDSKYFAMYMSESSDKSICDLEATPLNGKVKKLYYGKEYSPIIDTMKQKCGIEDTDNTISTSNNTEDYQYTVDMDLMLQDSSTASSLGGNEDASEFPYRSRCNTWPCLQPTQQNETNNVVTPSCENSSHQMDSNDNNVSYLDETPEQRLSKDIQNPNSADNSSDKSSSLLFGRLRSHNDKQQISHLTYSEGDSFSPSLESALTNRISGSYMLSHQVVQPTTTSPLLRASNISKQEGSLLNSFTSGPLPLLSEEDVVLDNDLLSLNKESVSQLDSQLKNAHGMDGNERVEQHGIELDNKIEADSNFETKIPSNINVKMTNDSHNLHGKEADKSNSTNPNTSEENNSPSLGGHQPNLQNFALGNIPSSGSSCGNNVTRRNAWGNLSYADLITQAIKSSPDQRLTLAQIYEWLITNIAHFRDKSDNVSSLGWKVRFSY